MSGIKISSKRAHLWFGSNNSNLEEDGGMRRRTSVMGITKLSRISWRNPMGGNYTLEDLMRIIKIFHEE